MILTHLALFSFFDGASEVGAPEPTGPKKDILFIANVSKLMMR